MNYEDNTKINWGIATEDLLKKTMDTKLANEIIADYRELLKIAQEAANIYVTNATDGQYSAINLAFDPTTNHLKFSVAPRTSGILWPSNYGVIPLDKLTEISWIVAKAKEDKVALESKRKQYQEELSKMKEMRTKAKELESRLKTQSLMLPDGCPYEIQLIY